MAYFKHELLMQLDLPLLLSSCGAWRAVPITALDYARRDEALAELDEELRQRCTHCTERKDDHIGGKCLFDATYFIATEVPT